MVWFGSREGKEATFSANVEHVMVGIPPSSSCAAMRSFCTEGTPPMAYRSAMKYFPEGARSAMKGILSETRWMSSSVRATPAVAAMARKWTTPLVLPPRAMVMTRAFSKERGVRRSQGLMLRSMQVLMASAALMHSRIFAGDDAGVEEEPGRERPMDSMAVAIVLAVYMPPQAPGPGQACCSMSSMIWSLVAVVSPPSEVGCWRVL